MRAIPGIALTRKGSRRTSGLRWSRIVRAVVLLLLAGGLWWSFGPQQLGGSAAYSMVAGISMEPHFHTGDLIVVHRSSSVHVGQVVAYRQPGTKAITLHRVIGRDGDRFIIKGDNNGWLDPYRPRMQDIVGVKWLYVPRGGLVFAYLHVPWIAAVFFGVLGMWVAVGVTKKADGDGDSAEESTEGGTVAETPDIEREPALV